MMGLTPAAMHIVRLSTNLAVGTTRIYFSEFCARLTGANDHGRDSGNKVSKLNIFFSQDTTGRLRAQSTQINRAKRL